MGPILSITFGLAVEDRNTVKKGLRNEFAGIFVAAITGVVMGFIASLFHTPEFRSVEMTGRGERKFFLYFSFGYKV